MAVLIFAPRTETVHDVMIHVMIQRRSPVVQFAQFRIFFRGSLRRPLRLGLLTDFDLMWCSKPLELVLRLPFVRRNIECNVKCDVEHDVECKLLI